MPFEKYTAPPPPAPPEKPQVRFVRSIIHITDTGIDKLGEWASKLKDATHVHLWHNPETKEVAITPADANDRDAFPIKEGKIKAKKFLDFAKIPVPVKGHERTLTPHEEGVKFKVVASPTTATRRRRSAAAADAAAPAAPKRTKSKWKPGDPIPTRGRKSAAQIAWLEEQKKKS